MASRPPPSMAVVLPVLLALGASSGVQAEAPGAARPDTTTALHLDGSLGWTHADDLERDTRSYRRRDTGTNWLSGESYDALRTSTVEVGQARYVLLATVSLGLGP